MLCNVVKSVVQEYDVFSALFWPGRATKCHLHIFLDRPGSDPLEHQLQDSFPEQVFLFLVPDRPLVSSCNQCKDSCFFSLRCCRIRVDARSGCEYGSMKRTNLQH